jgi:hypothetical protein
LRAGALIVPLELLLESRMKLGNSGAGKGPQLKADAGSDDDVRSTTSLITPDLFSKIAYSVTCDG